MNRLIILTFIIISNFQVFSQKTISPESNSLWNTITPPHGVHLYDSIYIDETEIANIHYLEYLHYVKIDSSESFYQSQLLDSTCWQTGLQQKDSISIQVYHYLNYAGYRYYPVIGVSYEQAVNYCKWRSAVVTNAFQQKDFLKKHSDLKGYEIKIEYRLPSKEEWEYAAAGGLDIKMYPHGLKRPLDSKKYKLKIKKNPVKECLDHNNIQYSPEGFIHKVEFNVLDDYYLNLDNPSVICKDDRTFRIQYMYGFVPNGYGLYNMIGNVAEMTYEKGIAKGGSFNEQLSNFTISTDFKYNKPTEWIGFRCLAVVHLTKK